MSSKKASFPQDFLWGVATSSYQIEGAVNEDERGPSIWDTFSATLGKVHNGESGAIACDHYHRWEADLDLMQKLGVNAYRFSTAWPRIMPNGTGPVNKKGLDFYDRLVDGLLGRGIKPFCTLYHWDLPQTLEDKGGWLNRDIVAAFVDYADVVTTKLGDRVLAYATLNEPWCSAHLGYGTGHHAPGIADTAKSLQAAHHLLLAHGSALSVMRRNAPKARHGIVLNLYPAQPASDSAQDIAAARRLDGFFNRWYLDPLFKGSYPEDAWAGYGESVPSLQDGDLQTIAAPMDFLGVNYYTRSLVADKESGDWPRVRAVTVPDAEYTEMGWEVYPQGLTDLLLRLHKDFRSLPIFITENGSAFADVLENDRVHDSARLHYLESHLEAVNEAIAQGVDVRGYFAWSLMDNFEWGHGYAKRFGLVYVDYETQKRVLKDSARWYSDFILRQQERAVLP